MKRRIISLLMIIGFAAVLSAETIIVTSEDSAAKLNLDYTHVTKVKAIKNPEGWRFDVSLLHEDTGWNHYANLWIVVDADTEEEYGRRILAHPHVNEQPFTRSQSGIGIPESVEAVIVKAACNIHGFGGTELLVELK